MTPTGVEDTEGRRSRATLTRSIEGDEDGSKKNRRTGIEDTEDRRSRVTLTRSVEGNEDGSKKNRLTDIEDTEGRSRRRRPLNPRGVSEISCVRRLLAVAGFVNRSSESIANLDLAHRHPARRARGILSWKPVNRPLCLAISR